MLRVFALGLLGLSICACSSPQKATTELASASEASSAQRQPAMHNYAGYDCTSGTLNLRYDGPGSNYAFGGYSNLYVANEKLAAYESAEENSQEKLGDEVADQKLEVLFRVESTSTIGKIKSSPRVGERCAPGERSYLSSEFKTHRVIVFEQLSARALAATGLKNGQKVKFSCKESSSTPISCPTSGRYRRDDL
ncbi:MAG: hypothetical protein KF681_04430 [Bdellovibrionaceae bacterium]|nr:hypothetical protein [Pseudobdellovibrionaceae bacterium]